MSACDNCLHKKVCGKHAATGGHVNECEHLAEEKHGQWLPQMLLGERIWDCSLCSTIGRPHWKRCPVCEAIMDGEANG